MAARGILVTGATGLIGQRALVRLLRADPDLTAFVLVRHPDRWPGRARFAWIGADRVIPIVGDVRSPGLGLDTGTRHRLREGVRGVLHLAADNRLAGSLEDARATNVAGTANLLDLVAGWPVRFCLLSTAYVAGNRAGTILETDRGGQAGWVNAAEQSKWEAEQLVRHHSPDPLVLRPGTVVVDTPAGRLTRPGVIPDALRLLRSGRVGILPGRLDCPVDLVPASYVARAVAALALRPDLSGETLHLCAGERAATAGDLLTMAWNYWSADPRWRRRTIPLPVMTDLATFRLFNATVDQTMDGRIAQITRSLSGFAPHLAMPKRFDTTRADAALGFSPPAVLDIWPRVLAGLPADDDPHPDHASPGELAPPAGQGPAGPARPAIAASGGAPQLPTGRNPAR